MTPKRGRTEATTLRWKTSLACALAGVAAYAGTHALARLPTLAERGYAQGIGPLIARPLSLLTGLVPFSVSELMLFGYVAWVILALVVAARSVAARRRTWPHALAGGTLRVVRDGGLAVFLLYALWGFNYARPPLETRLGWPEWRGAELAEVVALAEAAVEATNRAYLQLHGSEDAGAPTARPADPSALEAAVDQGWSRTAATLGLPASVARRYGRAKQPLSSLLDRLGIFGVYVPYTAEATVARGLPAVRLATSMAHEKAHQRGVAIEAEASFLGFLACSLSQDPLARYSAASFAQAQLVGALPARERRRIGAARLPGVVRDLQDLEEFMRRNDTVVGAVQERVNDRYLRANRVPGGIQSYGRSALLLIQYAREHPEHFAPGDLLAAVSAAP